MQRYNPKELEPKWQDQWEASKLYKTSDDSDKPKRYVLEYFPYPSGAAMHVGHVRNYTIGDAIARHSRMLGNNVLHPMGWDAFGLPAENFAIKNKISPRVAIDQNTERFKKQLRQMGFSYDWSREIDSTNPNYYKWTQWLFLMLFKKGLAYQQESLQWWCEVDKTVLANEQVESGKCWRCGNEVSKKLLKQWFFKITDYADRLLEDLEDLDWSDSIKAMQRNWIGRSKGAEVDFKIENHDAALKVFTTRPDTLFGATFMVLAPEHKLVNEITTADQKQSVDDYVKQAQNRSDIERQDTNREKTGVFTGAYAINPVNEAKVPIWIADYVLTGYGTGAIMAVPAHDERDWEFAKKFDIDIIRVIKNDTPDDQVSTGEGIMENSGKYDGQPSSEAREKIVSDLAKDKLAKEVVNYKMRDWLISRQRYWGAPIPIIHCPTDGAVAVEDSDLPVLLPEMDSYEPSGDGRSPLARAKDFVKVQCPKCGADAERETDTMDGFACSSWYFLRFADPHNDKAPFDSSKTDKWLPVDDYIGGAEHAVMHLLYARFWTKVMYDEKLINFNEPFKSLRNQGMILAPDGNKMSKSKGNTIEPDSLIEQGYGADCIRIMELFIGPWDQAVSWSIEGVGGCFRFLQRYWTLVQEYSETDGGTDESKELPKVMHATIKKISVDLEKLNFNTAIAGLMECVNELYRIKAKDNFKSQEWQWVLETLTQLLAPFAPHITEEVWQQLGQEESVHLSKWPAYDEKILVEDQVTIVVQVNGKVRGSIVVAKDASEDQVLEQAKADEKIAKYLENQEVKKTIFVPNKLVSFVIS